MVSPLIQYHERMAGFMRWIGWNIKDVLVRWARNVRGSSRTAGWFIHGAWPPPQHRPASIDAGLAWEIAQRLSLSMPTGYIVGYYVPWSMILSEGHRMRPLRHIVAIPAQIAPWCHVTISAPSGRLIAVILVHTGLRTDVLAHALSKTRIPVWVVYPSASGTIAYIVHGQSDGDTNEKPGRSNQW